MDELIKLMLDIEDDEEITESEELEIIRNYVFDYLERSYYEELETDIQLLNQTVTPSKNLVFCSE